jgi:hypothetical protein
MKKKYFDFDPSKGYPAGKTIFYECTNCASEIPSIPDRSIWCSCRNLSIDVDAGRISVDNESNLRAFTI